MAEAMARGFIIALPLLLVGLAVTQFYHFLAGWIRPLLDAMPGTVFHRQSIRFVAVLFGVVMLLLSIGWLARTRIGLATGRWLELALLSRLPFYNTFRTLASGLAGCEDSGHPQAALITVDAPGLDQLGLIVDRFADGRVAVYLPSSPNPGSGTVVIVEASRVRELRVPMRALLQCLGRWGQGTAALLEAASEAEDGSTRGESRSNPQATGCKQS